MIVLIPHLVVIFFLKLNKPIKLLQELLANIPQWSSPEAACRPQCRRVSVQAAGSSGGGCSIFPQPGHWNLQVTCLPTSQDNLATDGAATRNKVVFFNRPGMVQMLLGVGGVVFDAVCYGQPVSGDHGGYEDEQVDGRVHQGDLLPPQQEEGALHRALGPEEVSSSSLELETKVIRRFPKLSQSRRRPPVSRHEISSPTQLS